MRVGRHRVRRLMRLLGLEAIYRKPRTSVAIPERVYPYLLRGLTIERPNQVWCADTHPGAGRVLYLVAIMDWASRRSWRLSMDTEFCRLGSYGIPEIFNTDPASSPVAFTGLLETTGIRCSMDGRGRCLDNVHRAAVAVRGGVPARSERLHQRVIGEWMSTTSNDRTRRSPVARRRKLTVTGRRCEEEVGVANRNGRRPAWGARASAGEWEREQVEKVIHIYTGSFTPSPDPTPVTAA